MQNKEESQPFRWNACILRLSFLLQFCAFVLCGIAFFSPFWYIQLNTDIRAGLWGRCDKYLECIWFLERNYQKFLPGAFVRSYCSYNQSIDVIMDIGYFYFFWLIKYLYFILVVCLILYYYDW